jgi:hypothetical protein
VTPNGEDGKRRRPMVLQAISAVMGAFIGIRKGADRDKDLASLTPAQVIVTAVLGAALFVIVIVTLVRLITR